MPSTKPKYFISITFNIYIYIYTKKIYIKHTMIIMFQNTVKNY